MENQVDLKKEVFLFNLLKVLSSERQTLKEVWETYLRKFPPSFVERKLKLFIPQQKIQRGLTILVERGFVGREITRFTDRPLKRDVVVYCVLSAGTQALYSAKHKK